MQLKNDVLHVYIVNVDNTYEKMQETPVTSKDKENFLSSLLFQKYRKEAKDYFRYQKQEQDATTVYTVELTNNEKFSEYINKTDNKRGDIHFEELKLSYTIDGFENRHETALSYISGYGSRYPSISSYSLSAIYFSFRNSGDCFDAAIRRVLCSVVSVDNRLYSCS